MGLTLVVPRGETPLEPTLAKFSRADLDRYSSATLMRMRDRLVSVLDERTRQRSLFDEPEPEPESLALSLAPAPAVETTEPEPVSDVANSLSPSQLNCFVHDCEVKWWYRYGLKLPERSDTNRALGRAVHHAIAENFRQKIATKEDLDLAGCDALFRDALDRELAEVDGDPDRADLHDCGRALLGVFLEQSAPTIEPAQVEAHCSGRIGGVWVNGYVDLMDVDGNIIDVKTAAKKPSGVRPDYRVQVTSYAMLMPGASGRTRLDTLTKTKTVALHQQTIDITESDLKLAAKLYPLAQESMRGGMYTPNRGSFLCSRKYCSFWERCVDEFGGEVD